MKEVAVVREDHMGHAEMTAQQIWGGKIDAYNILKYKIIISQLHFLKTQPCLSEWDINLLK